MKRIVALASLVLLASSCYSYSYHHRQGPPNFQKVAIDTQLTKSKTVWSFFWGLAGEKVVAPLDCSEGDEENCQQQLAVCGGTPPGKVNVELNAGGALLMYFTFGIVVPATVTWYCSTEGEGPS
jgi:hypothetical protein